jgi:hypothetical protein
MKLKFKHSGHLGDLIYSLAAVKVMTEKSGEPCDFFIPSDVPSVYPPSARHPSGKVMVSEPIFRFIEPLLTHQSYIDRVHYGPLASVPRDVVDLDRFRTSGINLMAGFEPVWYRQCMAMPVPVEKPWLTVSGAPIQQPGPEIVVSRTLRFNNTSINYSLLQPFKSVGFVGLPEEYKHFTQQHALTNVRHFTVNNALEMARVMGACKLFVGNQSFSFAIAEGMKIDRALEYFAPIPVVIPIGGTCIEFVSTAALAHFLQNYFQRKLPPVPELNGRHVDIVP